MKTVDKPKHIKNIKALHQLVAAPPPEHPLMTIVRLEEIPPLPANFPRKTTYGFYCIGLKRNLSGYVEYGRKQYDFQEGVLGFTAPHQALSHKNNISQGATGWLLYFHAELLGRHPLADKIHEYGFFAYDVAEALHLSPKEEKIIEGVFENISNEYYQSIDKHSHSVILSNLELLLTYAQRFYSRQFITRHEVDSSLLNRFEKELSSYFNSEEQSQLGLPRVGYFADKLHVSANYLSDSLKLLTGKSPQEHIHFHLLEKAKHILLGTDLSISEIAYQLGFEYPQYFSRLFKDKVGLSPTEFRLNKNN